MKKVIIESPFKNSNPVIFNDNLFYLNAIARRLMLTHEVAPLYFHSLYTQCLNDNVHDERMKGLYTSFEFHTDSDVKFYAIDRGLSEGMILGAKDAIAKGIDIEFYTACPEDTTFGKIVNSINEVQDPQDKLEEASYKIQELLSDPQVKSKYEKTGDLSDYRTYLNKELAEVKDIMYSFFKPMIVQISKEKQKENSSELAI